MSKQKLQEMIEIKVKLVTNECPSTKLSNSLWKIVNAKTYGGRGESDFNEPYSKPKFSCSEIFAIDKYSDND